jgi:hypothetical protein
MRLRRAQWVALAFALGCAVPRLPGLPAAPPAQLAVEFTQGFAHGPEPSDPAGPERVEILLDVTSSMRTVTAAGRARLVAGRSAVSRLVRSLPEQTAIGLHAFGAAAEGECGAVVAVARSEPGQPRGALDRQVWWLTSRCEGSLAASLEELRAGLAAEGASARARVVAVTDLDGGDLDEEEAADLCTAVSALVSGGGRLDLVVLSDAPVPECVTGAVADGARVARGVGPAPPPRFRVEAHGAQDDAEARAVATGLADGRPTAVPAGAAMVVIELDPPWRIGPLMLSPEVLTRVRVLDFPTLDPRVREWVGTTQPAASDATPEPPTP